MAGTHIIQFKPGVTPEAATTAVTDTGGTVVREMRGEQTTLLVDATDLTEAETVLGALPDVELVEVNANDHHVLPVVEAEAEVTP